MEKKLGEKIKRSETKAQERTEGLEKRMIVTTEERLKKAIKKTDKSIKKLEKDMTKMISKNKGKFKSPRGGSNDKTESRESDDDKIGSPVKLKSRSNTVKSKKTSKELS